MWAHNVKVKEEGQTAGLGPCFHLPGAAAGFGKQGWLFKNGLPSDSEHFQMAVKNVAKLKRRGKPQFLVHVSTCQGQPFWCRFW